MVEGEVVDGVVDAPLVDVDGGECRGSAHRCQDGEDGGATAHVEHGLARQVRVEQVADDEACGLVMTRAKGHLGVDDDVVVGLGVVLVEGAVDDAAAVYHDGLEEVLLPLLVPVLILHLLCGEGDGGVFHGEVGEDGLQRLLVVEVGGDVAGGAVGRLDKTLKTLFHGQSGNDVVGGLADGAYGEADFDVFHVCFVV